VTRVETGRLVIFCDQCPVRLDLGPAEAVRNRNRTPSGWVNIGHDRHCCPRCSPDVTMAMLAQHAAGPRAQSLL